MFVVLLCVIFCSVHADVSIVKTTYGPVQGVVHDNYRAFKGVPFIAPPVGALRWSDPQPPVPWGPEPLPVLDYKPGCPQYCELPPHTCPDSLSEDCIYLNVFTPRMENISTLLPVMAFLPGGHFDQGTSGCSLYDGSNFVSNGSVILVTINYRIGFLGWLTTEYLTGNFGFRDQQMALKWIQQNIAEFGGDPNKVTLFGQSAGATSIRAHLVSPFSKGLFHKAISQSDPFPLPMRDKDDATSFGNLFVKQLGCSDIQCLRSKSTVEILVAQKEVESEINLSRPIELFLPFVPTVDGITVPYHIFDAIKQGTFYQVPMIIGDTSEDALLFVYQAANFSLNDVEYEAIITAIFGLDVISVSEEYPPYPVFGDKRPLLSILGTDYIFECPARYIQQLLYNNSNTTPLYLYQWNHALLDFLLWGNNYYCYGRVCHASELIYEFSGIELHRYVNFTAEEQILSQSIMGYFTNFAHSGNPNIGPYKPTLEWPLWDPNNKLNIQFATPNIVQKGLQDEYCNFWDTIGYLHGW